MNLDFHPKAKNTSNYVVTIQLLKKNGSWVMGDGFCNL